MAQIQSLLKPQNPIINWGKSLTKGLILDIPFFEGSGAPRDLVSKFTTTVTGTTWIKSLYGSTKSFPGGANTDNILTQTNITPTNFRTIELTFLLNATDATSRRIYSIEKVADGTSLVDQVLFDTTNLFQFQAGFSTTTGNWKISTPSTGVWHHLVVTYDASSVSNTPIMYLDNISQSVTQITAPVGSFNTTPEPMEIGNRFDNTRCWNGYIGYIRYWNRILISTEVNALYTNPWQIYVKPNYTPFYVPSPAAVATYQSTLMMMGMGM